MPVLSLWTPLTGSEILARQDEFYAYVSPGATQDLANLTKTWSVRLFAQVLRSGQMAKLMSGRQWSDAEIARMPPRSPIILNTITPFEQKPTPGRDVATLPGIRSKGSFI